MEERGGGERGSGCEKRGVKVRRREEEKCGKLCDPMAWWYDEMR